MDRKLKVARVGKAPGRKVGLIGQFGGERIWAHYWLALGEVDYQGWGSILEPTKFHILVGLVWGGLKTRTLLGARRLAGIGIQSG